MMHWRCGYFAGARPRLLRFKASNDISIPLGLHETPSLSLRHHWTLWSARWRRNWECQRNCRTIAPCPSLASACNNAKLSEHVFQSLVKFWLVTFLSIHNFCGCKDWFGTCVAKSSLTKESLRSHVGGRECSSVITKLKCDSKPAAGGRTTGRLKLSLQTAGFMARRWPHSCNQAPWYDAEQDWAEMDV